MLKIPEFKDIIQGELAVNGDWIVANVVTTMSWSVTPQKVPFRGVDIWILPATHGHYPGIALNRKGDLSRHAAEAILMQFLSVLSWVEGNGILLDFFSGGNLPRLMGRNDTHNAIQRDFDFSYFPEPSDERALLGLALMREGRGLRNSPYAFLSFYRVLEVALPDGKAREKWITDHIDQLTNHSAKEALEKLRATKVSDVGKHLRESGRHAIAHARDKPIVNPDDPSATKRITAELPIMMNLAELAIEKELGVETGSTNYRNHLYELQGFKAILGKDFLDQFLAATLPSGLEVDLPPISVELRMHAPYPPLCSLQPTQIGINGSFLTIEYVSANRAVGLFIHLDFKNERLEFNLDEMVVKDSGTAESAEDIAELKRFLRDYLCNGALRIINAETGELISRKDAFIPLNMFVNVDVCNADIEEWRQRAVQRRESSLVECP